MSPHWRSWGKDSEYLRAADLWDDKSEGYREATVQIERMQQGTVTGENGRKDKMPFAYFANTRSGKPLGLNASNAKTIARMVGTPNPDKWVGLWITLYVTQTESKTGEIVDCIRIRPKPAKPPRDAKADAPGADAPPLAGHGSDGK